MVPDDLLLPLLEGAFEEPLWGTFLDRLRARTGAGYASLIFRAPPPALPSLVHLYSGDASPPPVERLYRERLHARDPMPYHHLVEGRVHSLEEFLDSNDPEHQAFYRELLEPSRVRTSRSMRIVEPSGLNVWLSVSRQHGDFSADDIALIGALGPYLRSALRSYAAIERERYASALSGEAIRRLNYGWIALDAAGHVIEADAQGLQLLAHSDIIRRDPAGLLVARPAEIGREMAAAIREVLRDPARPPRAMILSREPWLDMLLVRAGGRRIAPGPPPALIAYIHGDGWSAADRCEQLGELFHLLPSEARLALALGRGMTISEAAGELGLTVETARTYSKKIYAKTGARGQSDLVRFIHRSVLAIA